MKLFGDDPVARKAKKRLDGYFDGRERLTHEEFHEHFFKKEGISEEVTTEVLNVFENQLEYDFSRISDIDDFSKELSVMWEIDSLADVEIIVALEEKFGVKISEEEAASMTTIRKVVECIDKKLKVEPVALSNVANAPSLMLDDLQKK